MTSTTMQLPAHIAARVAARAQTQTPKSSITAAILSGGFDYPKISIKASRYRLVDDGVETVVGPTLDVVFVGANDKVSKVYYSKPYDGSDAVRPDCFSNDGVTPDVTVETPQCESCAACPHNVLGSKINPSGAKSKRCGDQRHLAVVPAADPAKVYGITIPVSGMKGLREYFKDLSNYGVNPEEVVTQLGFDDSASFPKIVFSLKGYVPSEMLPVVDGIVASEDVQIAIRKLIPNAPAPALPAPPATPRLAVAPTPAPVATQAPVAAPVAAAPVVQENETPKASSELERKLASLFG